MMKKLTLLLLFFVLTLAAQSQESDEVKARINRIENSISPLFRIKGRDVPKYNLEERLKALNIPGVSIAFVSNGKVEWARAYGMADRGENRKMTTETMLLAGSISKPVAALRAHQMVENGTFSLDENVNNYLKTWQLPDNEFTETEKVTLRRILNHTAGLTVWGFPGYDKGDKVPSTTEVLDGKGNTDSVRVYKKPGESWMYSGGGYTIMQLMIDENEPVSFVESLQKHVLDPMGMEKSTFANPLPEKYHSLAATGYRGNGAEVEGKWPIYPEMAAAGLWTTPSQLIQYAIEVQRIDNSKEDGILKYESVKEMLTPGFNNHGLGPVVRKYFFEHGGADEGFRAQLMAWRDQPYAIVVMVNSDNGSIMREIILAVAEEYGLEGISPNELSTIEMAEADLQKFTGKFKVTDLGDCELSIENGQLKVTAAFLPKPLMLLPMTTNRFFDESDGTPFMFDIKEGKVVGFNVQRFRADRIDE